MKLYNTLTRQVEELRPVNPSYISFYACGPTVYDYAHIGNIRKYTMDDVLKRSLIYLGHNVKHVMNITDVGHLTGDDDTGEDKLEKGAKKSGKTVWDIVKFYTDFFFDTTDAVNIFRADIISKATDHIPEMIELIKILETKGFTYETDEALYFNAKKFSTYGKLSGQKLEDKKEGAREEVNIDPKKRHPADFALWFKRVGRFADHTMRWPSPWGDGFPGWHIECSAMSMKYLGDTIDIHSGGVDHIPVHHENEIAQSEAATGKKFVKHWVHHAFLNVSDEKMSKSKGTFITINDVKEQGIDPISLRLLFLQTHYRQEMNFSWEAAKAANEAYKRLKDIILDLKSNEKAEATVSAESQAILNQFKVALSNDLQTASAVALMWDVTRNHQLSPTDKLNLLYSFDKVFGLGLKELQKGAIPSEIMELARKREIARKSKDFAESDRLRKEITDKGYDVEDTAEGFKLKKS